MQAKLGYGRPRPSSHPFTTVALHSKAHVHVHAHPIPILAPSSPKVEALTTVFGKAAENHVHPQSGATEGIQSRSAAPRPWLKSLQLVQEIETQAVQAQREITVVKTAIAAKQREVRMLELTTSEVKSLPEDTKLYEGVGKM